MDQASTSSDDDQPKPSLIYNEANWVLPLPTSTETDSGTQGFTVRYVQYSRFFFFAIIIHHIMCPCSLCNPWTHPPPYIRLSRPKEALLNPISLPVFVSY